MPNRYDDMTYRRCGRSGLTAAGDLARALAQFRWHRRVRERPAPCAARLRPRHHPFRPRQQLRSAAGFGRGAFRTILRDDLAGHRDELIISTKAGYRMWPGPYGEWGCRKYVLASLDQSLQAAGPRLCRHLLFAPLRSGDAAGGDDGALDQAVRQGKALYVGISSYSAAKTAEAAAILRRWARPA